MMVAAVTDHVFIDEGHVLDFTNKAFECLRDIGWDHAGQVLPTLVTQTAAARRHEEESAWRHPDDLTVLLRESTANLEERLAAAKQGNFTDADVDALAWELLSESPHQVVGALDRSLDAGASPEQLARLSRSPPRCGSCGSTPRTITVTGTRSTTRSRLRMPCISASCAPPPRCSCEGSTSARFASTSTAF